MNEPLRPSHIGPYQVTDLLGQGAMSRVYRATLPLLGDQSYAVKLLRERCKPREISGFLGECAKVKRLGTHPHIVQLYFAGLDRRLLRYYVAMELIEGPTAAELLAETPEHQVPLTQVLQMSIQVASALEHAHQRGILHLDVKPSNILWQHHLAKLADFGSARLREEVSSFAVQPGQGTPAYHAWEQTPAGRQAGLIPTERSDLFSLCATLYHLLTGYLPLATAEGQVQPPSSLRPDLPPALDALLLRALSRDPQQRPATMYEFRRALEQFLAPQRVCTVAPLPARSTGLIGREALLRQLKARLLAGENLALCALNGLPGVGKTALAAALVHDPEIQAHFTEGILWGGLGLQPNLLALLNQWGIALSLSPTVMASLTSIEAWSTALHHTIDQRRLLLVIDDAWTLEAALACQVGGPHCAHLLTTRSTEVALHFAGTGTIRVPELDETSGAQLLEQVAHDAVAAEPEAATQLVRAAGGLPLALVLMGKYLQSEAYHGQPRRLRTALEHLQQTTERLRLERPLAPGDHLPSLPSGASLSLAASIAISYQALSKPTRSLLLALSVFPAKPNTFSEESALAVADCSPRALDALCNTGLLESSGPGRYTLHQTIADYARLKLHRADPSKRLAAFFVRYVEAHQMDYVLLDQESGNILAALQAAFDQKMQATLVQGINAFASFLLMRGDYATAEAHLTRAQQAASTAGQMADLATVQMHLGRLAVKRGDYALAEEALLEGLPLARQPGTEATLSALLQSLGHVKAKRGDSEQAEWYYQESLHLASQMGDQEMISLLLRNLGGLAHKRGDGAQATRYYQEALALARQVGQHENAGILLTNLGVVALTQGEYFQAEGYFQEGLLLSRQIGDRENMSRSLSNLGVLATQRQDQAQAESYQQEALDLARQIEHREMMAVLLTNLGDLAGKRDDYGQAQALFHEGLTLARQMNHRYLISYNLEEWGELHLRQRYFDQASATFSESLAIAREIQGQEVMALAFYGLARVSVAQGHMALALQQGQESLHLFETIGHSRTAEVQQWLANLPASVADHSRD